jgi:hypothetical protein
LPKDWTEKMHRSLYLRSFFLNVLCLAALRTLRLR